MARAWPFMPSPDVSESLEWRTELQRSVGYTQRIATRQHPRTRITHSYVLDRPDVGYAGLLAQGGEPLEVPLWPDHEQAGALSSGATSIAVTTTGKRFTNYAWVAEETDAHHTGELVAITSVTATRIYIESLANSYTSAIVVPTLECVVDFQATNTEAPALVCRTTALSTQETPAPTGPTYPTYKNYPLLTVRPFAESRDNFSRDWHQFDASVGKIARRPVYRYPSTRQQLRFDVIDLTEGIELKGWLADVKGRQKQFFYPSWNNDVTVIAGLGSSSLTIEDIGYSAFPVTGHLAGIDEAGVITPVGVTGSAPGSPGTEVLTLDDNLPSTSVMVSFLRTARLNTDKVELRYSYAGRIQCRVAIREDADELHST